MAKFFTVKTRAMALLPRPVSPERAVYSTRRGPRESGAGGSASAHTCRKNTADTATGFDTPVVIRKLEAAGVDRGQAEAHTEALRDGLATKADIARLEEEMASMATEGDFCRALCIRTGVILVMVAGLKLFG